MRPGRRNLYNDFTRHFNFNFIRELSRFALSLSLLRRLITTLILPHFDYCAAVYCDVGAELVNKLQRSFNLCIRFVHNLRRDDHVSPTRLQEGWLSIDNRILYSVATLFFSLLHTHEPAYLCELVTFPPPEVRATRVTCDRIFITVCRTEIYKRSFIVQAAYLWNSLPEDLVRSSSLTIFKRSFHDFLLAKERRAIATVSLNYDLTYLVIYNLFTIFIYYF